MKTKPQGIAAQFVMSRSPMARYAIEGRSELKAAASSKNISRLTFTMLCSSIANAVTLPMSALFVRKQ